MNSGFYGVPSVNEGVVANGGYWQPVDSMIPAMSTANESYSQIDPSGTSMTSYPEFSVVPSVVSSGASPTTCVTTDSSYRHPGSPAASKGGSGGRRRAVNRLPPNIDPCLIAPLKKRRIDENRLPNTEREKLVMKREKNRDAAAKCRMKKKAVTEKLREEHEFYSVNNKAMEEEIRDLLKEKETLERLLREHKCSSMAKSKA